MAIKDVILRLGREYIYKAQDAGCGMYNFYLSMPRFRGADYTDVAILQMYPFKEENPQFYGTMFLLLYYPSDTYEMTFEHDDINYDEMTPEEHEKLLNAFKKELGLTVNFE